jgi:hypothetical protein
MYFITEIILSSIGLLIYLIIKYPDRTFATRSRPDIDGVKGYPLIGNLLSVINNDVINLMHNVLMEYGPVS